MLLKKHVNCAMVTLYIRHKYFQCEMIKLNYLKNNFTKSKKCFAKIIYYDIMCLMLSEREGFMKRINEF